MRLGQTILNNVLINIYNATCNEYYIFCTSCMHESIYLFLFCLFPTFQIYILGGGDESMRNSWSLPESWLGLELIRIISRTNDTSKAPSHTA